MDLYLAADSGRLHQAMTCTAQLAHMSYRLGSDGTLLASPLPDTLRGGLLMLSDEEYTSFYMDMSELAAKYMGRKPDGVRKPRKITVISSPIQEEQ